MLDRAKEFLHLGELALANALYALFWAAIAALAQQGVKQPEWSHGGLRKAFGDEQIRKRSIYPRKFGDWLSDAYTLRLVACYVGKGVTVKKTRRLFEHARRFVSEVEGRLHR